MLQVEESMVIQNSFDFDFIILKYACILSKEDKHIVLNSFTKT